MKKTLFTLFICLLPIVGFGQSIFKRGIQVGTTDSVATVDSIVKYGNIFKMYEGDTRLTESDVIGDTITQLKADALPLGDYAPLLTDSTVKYVTPTQMYSYIGSGGGVTGKFYVLTGNVDGLGFPDAGDTSLTHTNFIGKHITVIREGQVQQQHADNTEQDGFWLNNTTGEVRFRPALGAGEQIEIWATNTIQWESLVAEEGGGEAESSLLTGLKGSWKLDEVSGTTVNDAFGTNDGTSYATVGSTGKIGLGQRFDTNTDYITIPYNASMAFSGDELSVSMWVMFDNILGNYSWLVQYETTTWTEPMRVYVDDVGSLHFRVKNSGGTEYEAYTADGKFASDLWYNVIAVVRGDGNPLELYINGSEESTSADTFTGTLMLWDRTITVGNNVDSGTLAPDGWMDDFHFWGKALTAGEIAILNTPATYPW